MSSVFKDFKPDNESDYQDLFINQFFNLWMWLFRFKIKGDQDFLAVIQLYKAFSVLAMKNNLFYIGGQDLRLFPIIFSDAGSGKGMTGTLYNKVFGCNLIGKGLLRIKTVRKPTNEKLVGSWDSSAQELNAKKGFTEGHDRWVDPKIPGYFEDYDDVVLEEALHIFQRETDIQTTLRCVADNFGDATNWLSSETLKNRQNNGYYARSSWGTFSYHLDDPKKLSADLVHNGLYQRSLCVFIRLEESQITEIVDNRNNYSAHQVEVYEERCNILTNLVARHFEKYHDLTLNITDGAYSLLVKQVHEMRNALKLKFTKEEERRIFDSYVVRAKNNIIKLACLNAVMKSRPIVIKDNLRVCFAIEEDVLVASEIVKLCINSVLEEIKPVMTRELGLQYINDVRKILGKGIMTKGEIAKTMGEFWDCNTTTAMKRINMILYIFSVKQGNKNEKWLRLK